MSFHALEYFRKALLGDEKSHSRDYNATRHPLSSAATTTKDVGDEHLRLVKVSVLTQSNFSSQ